MTSKSKYTAEKKHYKTISITKTMIEKYCLIINNYTSVQYLSSRCTNNN